VPLIAWSDKHAAVPFGMTLATCSSIAKFLSSTTPRTSTLCWGGYYGNALYAACILGHDKIAEMLLEKGADVNAQGGQYSNALEAACDNGHEMITKMLL
jgi:hypothetical protein